MEKEIVNLVRLAMELKVDKEAFKKYLEQKKNVTVTK
jgi:hypothetical protein